MILEYFGTSTGEKWLTQYGLVKNMYHFCEECCELYVELIHEIRTETRLQDFDKLQEEICDVLLLVDDLWRVFGKNIEKHYRCRVKIFFEVACVLTRNELREKLLKELSECVYICTEHGTIPTYSELVSEHIAKMLIVLESYMHFVDDGIDNMMLKKMDKRERMLNGEKF